MKNDFAFNLNLKLDLSNVIEELTEILDKLKEIQNREENDDGIQL